MLIHVYKTTQRPRIPHDYYIKLEGTMFPEQFDPSEHAEDVVILLESGIITPTPAQRDRISEIQAAAMPEATYHFDADE